MLLLCSQLLIVWLFVDYLLIICWLLFWTVYPGGSFREFPTNIGLVGWVSIPPEKLAAQHKRRLGELYTVGWVQSCLETFCILSFPWYFKFLFKWYLVRLLSTISTCLSISFFGYFSQKPPLKLLLLSWHLHYLVNFKSRNVT